MDIRDYTCNTSGLIAHGRQTSAVETRDNECQGTKKSLYSHYRRTFLLDNCVEINARCVETKKKVTSCVEIKEKVT